MQNSVERNYRRFAEKNAILRYLSKVLVLVKERRKDSSLQIHESRLSYFNDKARINYCKPSVCPMKENSLALKIGTASGCRVQTLPSWRW